jgi:hypothetical protein
VHASAPTIIQNSRRKSVLEALVTCQDRRRRRRRRRRRKRKMHVLVLMAAAAL